MSSTGSAPTLNPVLRSFWEAKFDEQGERIRYRILDGGRGSSKSWDAAGFAVFLSQACKIRVLCTRQFQSKIEESVYTLLKMQIYRFGLGHKFEILNNKIRCLATGSEFIFYGISRNIDEIKSTEDIDIHWAEEAHLLNEAQWKVIEATIRREGSQHWIIFNPKLITDFVYKRFITNPPPGTIRRRINYDENQFLSSTILRVIKAAKEEDYESYMHVYEGQPLTNDETSIIKRSWLLAAVDAHIKLGIEPLGSKRLGFDVADDGEDKCALVASHGPLTFWTDQWKAREDELLKSCTRTWNKARELDSKVIYDAIGVGAGSGAKFNELNEQGSGKIAHEKFFAGGSVAKPESFYDTVAKIKNKDFFSNIKAQAWWLVGDRLKNTYNAVHNGHVFDMDEMLFLDANTPNLTALIDELSTPHKDYDLAGRVKVESKKDLKKRDIKSPNLADAYIMANLPSEMKRRSFFG